MYKVIQDTLTCSQCRKMETRNFKDIRKVMSMKFYVNHLPDAKNEYVCWIDVMGIQSVMSVSLKRTANFVFKLHAAAVLHKQEDVMLYPIMDGLYCSSENKKSIIEFIKNLFSTIMDIFVSEKNMEYKFLIKGALAYGPVIHGKDIPSKASKELSKHEDYKNALLLGMPMVQSNQSEKYAPPFGIFIHESARAFAPVGDQPLHTVWFKWFEDEKKSAYSKAIEEYFQWCVGRANMIQYPKDRIPVHSELAKEYFLEK